MLEASLNRRIPATSAKRIMTATDKYGLQWDDNLYDASVWELLRHIPRPALPPDDLYGGELVSQGRGEEVSRPQNVSRCLNRNKRS